MAAIVACFLASSSCLALSAVRSRIARILAWTRTNTLIAAVFRMPSKCFLFASLASFRRLAALSMITAARRFFNVYCVRWKRANACA